MLAVRGTCDVHSDQPRSDLLVTASDWDLGCREKRKTLTAGCPEEHMGQRGLSTVPAEQDRFCKPC